MWRPDGSEAIEPTALANPLAIATVRYLEKHCSDFAGLLECRHLGNGRIEIVSFELVVELPQRPAYDIRPSETISIGFVKDNTMPPGIVVARDDFPDTPHQNLVPEGCPSMICIDDRPWQDVRAGYTASELMTRISTWFTKAGQGELHGTDQPFDPFFGYDSPHQIILTADGVKALDKRARLNVWASDQTLKYLLVTSAEEDGKQDRAMKLLLVSVEIEPQKMSRIRRAPRHMAGLLSLIRERQPSFVDDLKSSVLEWFQAGKHDGDDTWIFGILARFPQLHPRTGEIGATKPMAFLSDSSPGKLGVALGILDVNISDIEGGPRYLKTLFPDASFTGLEAFGVQVAPVHLELDTRSAATLAGHPEGDERRVALIGAGSLGSNIAENLAREGLFQWTIIDDDDLLPHNIARHVLTREQIGLPKAPLLARRILAIRPDTAPAALVENVLCENTSESLAVALNSADLIIDASASVPVSRYLSDNGATGRRLCAFFTPDGSSAVLMVEAQDRSTRLRAIEACYLHEVMTNSDLEEHFSSGEQLRYTGACRALTSRIPMSRVTVLAGLISSGISDCLSSDDAALRIWSVDPSGSICCLDVEVRALEHRGGEWTVLIPQALEHELRDRRRDALPSETGGVLLGMIDYEMKIISVAFSPAAPADSVGKTASFVRGTRGLKRTIDKAERRSGGQIRYIGEWHSHPPEASAEPSPTDLVQIGDLSVILDMDGLPAISIILSDDDIRILIGSVD